MVTLVLGRPLSTETPSLEVDAGLKPGRHRFRLIVASSGGRVSQPVELDVEVSTRIRGPAARAQAATDAASPKAHPGATKTTTPRAPTPVKRSEKT